MHAISGLAIVALMALAAVAAPPQAVKKPKFTNAPLADLSKPIIWGSECETPDGRGLRFGGCDQQADDGAVHTQIKVDGQWQPILAELRKANPMQEVTTGCAKPARRRSGYWPAVAASISKGLPADQQWAAFAGRGKLLKLPDLPRVFPWQKELVAAAGIKRPLDAAQKGPTGSVRAASQQGSRRAGRASSGTDPEAITPSTACGL